MEAKQKINWTDWHHCSYCRYYCCCQWWSMKQCTQVQTTMWCLLIQNLICHYLAFVCEDNWLIIKYYYQLGYTWRQWSIALYRSFSINTSNYDFKEDALHHHKQQSLEYREYSWLVWLVTLVFLNLALIQVQGFNKLCLDNAVKMTTKSAPVFNEWLKVTARI